MATVRGMTPEAIRALLKKELGDYQALSIAVNSAKGASESAVAEVEKLRNNIDNMDFDIDMSEYNEAMEKFETDMTELNQNLDELKEEALSRENKLTALDAALKRDRSKFDKEMQKMAKELSDSKEKLQKDLSDAADKLAQNVVDVGDRLSGELDNANKTLSESLAKDLKKLDTDLSEAFGKDLKALETSQKAKTDALDEALKNYKKNTDSKVSTLLSDIEKAKAYADGFMQPGNLVWNPMALDNARDIFSNNNTTNVSYKDYTGRSSGTGVKLTKGSGSTSYISYGGSKYSTFDVSEGNSFQLSAWVKSSVALPARALGLLVTKCSPKYGPAIPANTWTKISVEVTPSFGGSDSFGFFQVYVTSSVPKGATIIVSEPHAVQKVTSNLIVDGAVMSKSLATGAVVAGKIASDAITANNIVAGSIGAKQIAAKSIGADQLAANAVTADKIVGNSIDASKIKSKSIGADQLAANAVTTEKLASKAVKADNIDANAVTSQKIASKAINGDHIQANSIDTTKLTIMPGNLFPDPHFQDSCWVDSGQVYAHKNNGGELRFYPINAQIGKYYQPSGMGDKSMLLEKNSVYRITANIWANSNITKGMKIDVYMRYTDTRGSKSIKLIGSIPVTVGTSMESEMLTTAENMRDSECTIGFFVNKPWNGGLVSMWDVHLTRAADASLIVKGGVQADHIASNAITTRHMSADSIDGDRIKSDTLDARKIKASTLTSDRVTFKEGFIKRAMIGDGEIDNGKIKNLDAGKINAGTMHGDRIQAGTLDANRIKANTLSADQIATGTLNADRIGTRSITASKIATKTIGADQLAADAITSDKIKANAIQGKHIAADTITVNQLRAGTIVPIGGSLIHSEPKVSGGVPEPIWWQVCDTELAANYRGYPRPDGNPWRMCSQAQSKSLDIAPPKRLVKIKPGQKYRLTFWCRGTKANTRMYIEMRDQKGDHAVKSGAVYGTVNSGNYKTASQAKEAWPVTDFSESKTGSYLVSNFTLPTSITKVTSTIEFKDDVEYVYLGKFFFNHRSSSAQGNQWISGLSLELEIPDQAAIDARQDRVALYLKKMVENMSRMMARIEAYKPDFTTIPKRFAGVVSHKGVGIVTDTRDRIHIFMDPTWTGVVRIQAFYSMPKQPTSVAFFDLDESDFNLHSQSTCPQDPPPNFPYRNGSFKYTSVSSKYDDHPNSYGFESATMFITYDMSYKEMFELLSSQVVPLTGSLTYGRNVPPPPLSNSKEEGVPWDHMGTIRR